MVNASLNWASLMGILLALYAMPAFYLAIFQLAFKLSRRTDNTTRIILDVLYCLVRAVGRFLLFMVGGILFFQGWRLDPILQFGQFLLVLGLIVESAGSVVSDYQELEQRESKARTLKEVS